MSPEAKVCAVLRSLLRDGVEDLFGEGARVELPAGESPNEAESFAIVMPRQNVTGVKVITVTVSRL